MTIYVNLILFVNAIVDSIVNFAYSQVSAVAMKDAKVPYGSIVNISSISGKFK
jgi:NAD(P)-dependent dehydrogenase (short-subunit alcohol dehydrogenase family)